MSDQHVGFQSHVASKRTSDSSYCLQQSAAEPPKDRPVPFGPITLLLVTAWALLLTCSELRNTEKYIFWYGTIPVMLVLGRHYGRIPWRSIKCVMVGGALLVTAVLSTVLGGANPTYCLLEAGKLATLLLLIAPLFATASSLGVALLLGVEISTYFNCALIALWWIGGFPVVMLVGPGRFATLLAAVGTLWRIGAISLVWSLLRYLDGTPLNPRNLAAIAAALGMIALDGARTGVLAVGLAGVATLCYLAVRRPHFARLLISTVFAVGLLGIGLSWISGSETSDSASGDSLRALDFASALLSREDSGLARDDVREAMWNDVLAAIQAHPFLGRGMGTSRTPLAGNGDMVNHFSYFQMWADTGLLGFVSYLTVIAGLAAQACWLLSRRLGSMSGAQARAAFTGVYLLVCWAMACSFHAVSTELTEWLMYLAGLALVSDMMRGHEGPDRRPHFIGLPHRSSSRVAHAASIGTVALHLKDVGI